ncbi:IclR family transcriptional regulator [Bacillus sp. B15-48]|uniref:IclR family transcriptional regulator domain-containing protein n=1 Tax=Bacillus sp. B15-48 TaxID=1548601 RepID=UPI00193F0C1A
MRDVNIKLNQSIEKAKSILDCFAYDQQYLTIEYICKVVEIPKPTAYRLLYTMETLGLIHYNEKDATYCLGMKMFEYGGIVLGRLQVINVANQYLSALHHETGFTVLLAILEGGNLIYIDKRATREGFGYTSTIGRFRDPHYGALGKVLMAYLDEDMILKLLQKTPLKKYTEYSITDPAIFLEKMKQTKQQGYYIDNEEVVLNITAVAAPIKNKFGEIIAAVTVAGPKEEIQNYSLSKLVKNTCHYTDLISTEL